MPSARHAVFAVALAAMIASAAPAEQRATTARPRSTRMPGLSRIAYRSFWPQERYNRQFAEAGDPFYANDELIALHSGGGGRRTFRLPEARKVTELFEERTVSDSPVMEFTETFEPMETRLYWLERN